MPFSILEEKKKKERIGKRIEGREGERKQMNVKEERFHTELELVVFKHYFILGYSNKIS